MAKTWYKVKDEMSGRITVVRDVSSIKELIDKGKTL